MNNNECCMTESRRCVADYEKTTREHLLEARGILRSVYMTISGKGGENLAEGYGCESGAAAGYHR
jgi:hypothetical protein